MIDDKGVHLRMTWPKVLAICATVVASAFGASGWIAESWLGSMDRNIAQLQGEFSTAMQQNVALQAAFGGTRADLIKDISETREIVAANSVKLDDIKGDIGSLRAQIAEMRSDNRNLRDFMSKMPGFAK